MKNTIHNTLQIWNIPLFLPDSLYEGYLEELTDNEKTRALQFRFDKHRRRYIVSHVAMRRILAQQLYIPKEEVQIHTQDRGKPYIPTNQIYFNLSHSEEMAVLAVSRISNVGIDIEYLNSNIDTLEIAKRFFHPLEYEQLKNINLESRKKYFYYCWTGKEAFLKTTGLGVSENLKSFSLHFLDPNNIHIIFSTKELSEFQLWSAHTYQPNDQYFSTVVSTKHHEKIIYHEFQNSTT